LSSTDAKRIYAFAALALLAAAAIILSLRSEHEGAPGAGGEEPGRGPQDDRSRLQPRVTASPGASKDLRGPAGSSPAGEAPSGLSAGAGATETCAIEIRLLDESTGRPLSGEDVTVTLRGESILRPETARTDADGKFRLERVRPGLYSLETRHADYLPDARSVELAAESGQEEVEIPLAPGEGVGGVFVDGASKPVSGVSLALALADGSAIDNVRARSAADGSFLLKGLRPGKWSLSAIHEGFRAVRREVLVPSPAPLQIELSEDPGFLVSVRDVEARPVSGARVMVLGRTGGLSGGRSSGLTGPDGDIQLRGLPEDASELVPIEVKHSEFVPEERQVSAGDLLGGPLTITLSRGSELSGRVVDARGGAVPNAEVRMGSRSGAFQKTIKTTEAGAFQLRKVPAGSYEIAVVTAHRGYAVLSDVRLDGTESSSGLEIILREGAGVVAGRAVDPSGKPVPLCAVELLISSARGAAAGTAESPSGDLALRTITGEDGTFRFAGLPETASAGRCLLKAGGGKLSATEAIEVRPGQEDIKLEVERLGSVVGIVSTRGTPRGYTVVLTPEEGAEAHEREGRFQFSSSALWFRLPGVSPGTYTVAVVTADGKRAEAKGVKVLPGQETGPIQLK
jgi:protocatechuate 3,4-dioxygenase beta subunit